MDDTKAEEIAKSLADEKTPKEKREGVSSSQIRRFYDEVKRYDRIFESRPEEWEKQEPYIRMLKSKIAYTVARAKKSVDYYKNLEMTLTSAIDCVKSVEDYHVFVALFEAFYGYYYALAPKEN